jgi:hypothetical protein
MDKPQKTESEQLNFFALCYMKFSEACQIMGEVRHYYEIAGKRVCLAFAGEKMISSITPALEHLRIQNTYQPELTICIWDTESTSVEIPDAQCDPYCFTHRGDIKGFNSHRIKTAYQWSENSLSILDLYTHTAVFWIKSYKKPPSSVTLAPFHTLFQWWFEKQNCMLIQASTVGTEKGVILLSGNSNEYNYFKVQLTPFPSISNLYKIHGDDSDHKVLLEKNIPLKAIFISECHSDAVSTIESLSHVNALRKISFELMSQLPGSGRHMLHFISALLHKAPAFKLKRGTNFSLLQDLFFDFLINPDKYHQKDKKKIQSQKPLVSLIIPVFNGERFIREAIENVISQNYTNLEIIIVNDGSTDRTEDVIGSINGKFQYIRQENKGPASARNRGLNEANGDFIAFLDADDLFPEGNLNALINEMLQQPELEVVHGYAQILQKNPVTDKFEHAVSPKESYPNYICAGLYRKSVFDKVGFFDPSLRFSEDTDWFLRAKELNCKIKRIDEVCLLVRRHEHNMTKGKDLNELQVPLVLKRKLDRKIRSA